MPLAPGPRLPAVVQTLLFARRVDRYLTDCHVRYGDVFAIKTLVFGRETCVVRPEHLRQIFTGDPDGLRAGEANEALGPLVGVNSVLLLDGAEHLRQRRLMMPSFHGERIREYRQTMRDITERAVDGWRAGEPIVMHPEMQRITLEMILRLIFGADEGAELDALRDAITAMLDLVSKPLAMIGTIPRMRREIFGLSPWAWFRRAIDRSDALIYRQIARRRAAGTAGRSDVLSLLLDARDESGERGGMSDLELRDELVTLLAAGHETTATELSWAFDRVLGEPRVLAKLTAEIAAAGDDVDKLPYLDATIKEVMRLRPVIPAVGRRVKKDITIGGFDVPAGELLVPVMWLTHRQPSLYPRPTAFEPERFLDRKPDPYEWAPFGGGIRRCLGMAFAMLEMKIVLATVLSRVTLRLVDAEPARVTLRSFTHAPKGGVPVVVTRRLTRSSCSRRESDETPAPPA